MLLIHLNINCHALYTFKYKLLFSLHIKMKCVALPLHSMEIVSPSTSKMEIVTHCYIKLEIIILLNGKKKCLYPFK